MTDNRQNYIQMLKFTLFSASAAIIQVVSFTILEQVTNWRYWPCYIPSLALSVIWNCTFNRKFTFKSAVNINKAILLALLFYVPFTPASTWWGTALENEGWNEYLILGVTMIANFVLEFIWQKFVVFRDKKEQ